MADKDKDIGGADNQETARDLAEGKDVEDLQRDPERDELETDSTVPDPEDELLEEDETHYTDENEL